MKKQILLVGVAVLIGALIAVGTGWAGGPGGGPPGNGQPAPPGPVSASERSNLPSGFYPYQGYHYSGYVVGIDQKNKSFLYDIGGGIETVKTDSQTVFFRLEERHGREQPQSFGDLKLNQLVWLRGVEDETGKVVLKIQLSNWIR